jgi:AraC-like DNA-binding protein
MMDETEHSSLSHIPMQSMALRLARATIKMDHGRSWKIDKVNPVNDLIVCLSGQAIYRIGEDDERITVGPGQALLIPAYTRFRGTHYGGPDRLTGIAQHFALELFGRGDMVKQLQLRRSVTLPDWAFHGPLVEHYRTHAPFGTTTLSQHHKFMLILLAYLDAAFVSWQGPQDVPDSQDQLSVQIMLAASSLSADPVGDGMGEVLAKLPYNEDYFRRAFKERIGLTPTKFRELKRMEFAASRLGMGLTVKAVAAELGYADPYYFSRMFKRYIGTSPSFITTR